MGEFPEGVEEGPSVEPESQHESNSDNGARQLCLNGQPERIVVSLKAGCLIVRLLEKLVDQTIRVGPSGSRSPQSMADQAGDDQVGSECSPELVVVSQRPDCRLITHHSPRGRRTCAVSTKTSGTSSTEYH